MWLNRVVIGDVLVIFPSQREIVALFTIKYDIAKHTHTHKTRQGKGQGLTNLTGIDTVGPLDLGSLSLRWAMET